MSVDTIADFLTIIRNGISSSKRRIEAPYSNLKEQLAKILLEEGFIASFSIEEDEDKHKMLRVNLKYVNGESVIHEIKRISTSGCRVYKGSNEIRPVIGGLGVSIMTTSKGVLTNKQAKRLGVGGEIICTVW